MSNTHVEPMHQLAGNLPPATQTVTLNSRGRCVVLGDAPAVAVAVELSSDLDVTLCLAHGPERSDFPPGLRVEHGAIAGCRGSFSDFEILVRSPDGRLKAIAADIVLDLSGGRSLFAGCGDRDGYLRARPGDEPGIREAMTSARALVGEFEKPLYVALAAELCAHARSGRIGCTRCLDRCPAGAIRPDGDHVRVDAGLCEGCGSCAGGCPTGALTATMPASAVLSQQFLARKRDGADGALICEQPRSLDLAEAIVGSMSANLVAIPVHSVLQLGHETLLGLLASGARFVAILVPPRHRDHLAGLEAQIAIADAMLVGLGFGERRIVMTSGGDPDVICRELGALDHLPCIDAPGFGQVGSKREIASNILDTLHAAAPRPTAVVALPQGSPYGTVLLDHERCTLCLACVGACPVQALHDSRDRPELAFDERACVQCGLCVATCPEGALSLLPRIDFTARRGQATMLKSEAPCICLSCGKPFGTASAIQRVKQRLVGNSHFSAPGRLDLVEMCADCRVRAFLGQQAQPLAGAPRPRPRTSDDYHSALGSVAAEPTLVQADAPKKCDPSDPTRA